MFCPHEILWKIGFFLQQEDHSKKNLIVSLPSS